MRFSRFAFLLAVVAASAAVLSADGITPRLLLTGPTELIIPRDAAPQILVPAAGSIAGANGTFFHSDITIANYRSAEQLISLQWLPQSISGTATPQRRFTLPARSLISNEDFVTVAVQQSGLGAIVVSGIKSDGTVDPSALLYVTCRIWTPHPLGLGTMSQTLNVIATSDINSFEQTLLGHRIEERFRTNVGIVNLDGTSARTFDILQNSADATMPVVTTVTVLPLSMVQTNLPNASAQLLQIKVVPRAGTDFKLWVAYASSIDNISGDAWSSLGFGAPAPQ
jgi:hypothetical protein